MIKALAGFFRTLLLLALLGLVGYNILETRKLQAEVDLLRQHVSGEKTRLSQTPRERETGNTDIGAKITNRVMPGWVKDAQAHVERARVFLRTNRYEEARAEAEKALALVQKNGRAAQRQSAETVQNLHRATETVRTEATTLWNQINQSARPNKKP